MRRVVLAIFALRYWSATRQAAAQLAHDAAYRKLIEQSTTVEAQQSHSLTAIEGSLADVRTRLASIEAMLKAVG